MVFDVKNKVFFVTGAANGIGAGTVRILAEGGAKHVAILDLSEDKGLEFEKELVSKYGPRKAKFYKCDVTNEQQLFGAYESVTAEQGQIDVVINNAGILNDSMTTFKKEIDINVTALISSTYKALELMRKDEGGKGGTIINISSIAALHSSPVFPVYFTTKSAVLQFGRCLGTEAYYANTGVRLITMCFGVTATALYDNMNNFDKNVHNKIAEYVNSYPSQKMETAAKALVEVYKVGENGSVWLSTSEKPVQNITETVNKAYDLFHDLVWK